MTQVGFKAANRRYFKVFWPMMALYVVLIFATTWAVGTDSAPLWARPLAAIVTAAPLMVVLWSMLRLALETDEYTRIQHLQGLAVGGALTAGAIMLVGLFQIFDVIGSIEVFWFGPLYFVAFGLSRAALHVRQERA